MMTAATTQPTVSLADVANELGAGGQIELARAKANALGAKIDVDWRGAELISEADAAKLVKVWRAEQAADDAHRREVFGAHRQWEHDRGAVFQAAYAKRHAEELKAQVASAVRLHEGGTDPDDTGYGRGWARGGFPVTTRPDPRVHQRALESAREARDRWLAKHPEPTL